MIQRIQSVYLFLAGIISFILLFVPLAHFSNGNSSVALYAAGLKASGNALSSLQWTPYLSVGLIGFLLITTLLCFYTIFVYKNRKKQIRLCTCAIAIIILFYIAYISYGVSFANTLGLAFSPNPIVFVNILSIVFVFLARNAIKKDDELVRAADRIR